MKKILSYVFSIKIMSVGIDPYFLAKKEIEEGIFKLKQDLQIRDDMAQGGNSDIFRSIGIEMETSINFINNFLSDIRQSIIKCQNEPGWNISSIELAQRTQFVQSTEKEIQDIEKRMNVQSIRFPSVSNNNSKNINSSQSSLQLQARHEEKLSQIHQAVKIQHQMAKEIAADLEADKKVIEGLNQRMDSADQAMKAVTKEIITLINEEGKTPTMLVIILSLVLIFLLFIVV